MSPSTDPSKATRSGKFMDISGLGPGGDVPLIQHGLHPAPHCSEGTSRTGPSSAGAYGAHLQHPVVIFRTFVAIDVLGLGRVVWPGRLLAGGRGSSDFDGVT